ncbi:hypothetical protein RMATCC62417_01128 [Rhizopus microsporus]|nr:hypothetical protein RMATCC62417_01128 [Rhizopus microsporus]CEI85817.1 hypothetical protein RMCBS344292_00268 [Rhizopus microsporus]
MEISVANINILNYYVSEQEANDSTIQMSFYTCSYLGHTKSMHLKLTIKTVLENIENNLNVLKNYDK